MTRFAVSTAFVALLSACQPNTLNKHESGPVPGAATDQQGEPLTVRPANPKQNGKDANCNAMISRLNKGTAQFTAKPQTYRIERHFQRVVRKDCKGLVASDKIETVRPPTVDIKLDLPEDVKPDKSFQSVFVFNETSCDHKLTTMPVTNAPILGSFYAVTGDGKRAIKLKADLATALFTFEVKPGPNDIFVDYFFDCRPSTIPGNSRVIVGETNCAESKVHAIGRFPVMIESSESMLPGLTTIEPSVEECQAEARKK